MSHKSQLPPDAKKPIGWHRTTGHKQKLTPFCVIDKYLDGEKITGWPSFHARRILERVENEGYEIRPSRPEVLAGAGLIRKGGIVDGPGFRRIRRGRGFSYVDAHWAPIDDHETLERIESLVIPPAWMNVWICRDANGHIQAVGTDAAGRRQYLYHRQWQADRAEEKYDRVLSLAQRLPDWRAAILTDLRARGLHRKRVLAVAQHLVDRGYFRAGGEEYAQENGSFGLATLRRDHVRLHSKHVEFDYPAKSGVRRTVSIQDAPLIRAVRSLLRADTTIPRLLVYRTPDGWSEVHADDLNGRFRELVGDEFSVKDIRTWHGTVIAAEGFATAPEPMSSTARRRAEAAVMRAVAEELGNTPAVARGSYVDPRVVRAYGQGVTIAAALRRAQRERTPARRQHLVERATARMIKRIGRR